MCFLVSFFVAGVAHNGEDSAGGEDAAGGFKSLECFVGFCGELMVVSRKVAEVEHDDGCTSWSEIVGHARMRCVVKGDAVEAVDLLDDRLCRIDCLLLNVVSDDLAVCTDAFC